MTQERPTANAGMRIDHPPAHLPPPQRSRWQKCKRRLRKINWLTLVQIGGVVLIVLAPIVAILASYNGRQTIVINNRTACLRGAANLVATVNSLRADQIGNTIVASDPTQSAQTREARSKEAATQDQSVRVLDSHIDSGVWMRLKYHADQVIVRYGLPLATDGTRRRLKPFRCAQAYPNASPFVILR